MQTATRLARVVTASLALSSLVACVAPAPVYQTSHYPYQPAALASPAVPVSYLEYGRVTNIEVLRSETAGTAPTGGGAVAGGVLGGVVGNQFGHGSGRAAATALGVVGGALLGNSIEANRNAPRVHESYRISIETDQGGYRAFDVPTPGDLRVGDRVRIDSGQISRF